MGNYLDGKTLNYWETCTRTKIDGTSSEKRIPICLCLDLSGSMWQGHKGSRPVDKLIKALKKFVNDIKSNANGRSAEIAVIAFVNKGVILQDFTLAENMTQSVMDRLCNSFLPNYEHIADEHRCGDLETGVIQALALLDARKDLYQQYGMSYWQPMLVIMTDGAPTRNSGARLKRVSVESLTPMIQEIKTRRESRKLSVISVLCSNGIREAAAKSLLQMLINPTDQVYVFGDGQEKSFNDFFLFLSMSVSAASRGKAVNVERFQQKLTADSTQEEVFSSDLEQPLFDDIPSPQEYIHTTEEQDELLKQFVEDID